MSERQHLEKAIGALEAQREVLGDDVVDAALGPLRDRIVALAAREAPEQQRKHVSLLMADVANFTAMSEAMDAEEVGDAMNALWQRVDALIVAFGGMVDKHAGDSVMAVWGASGAREDDAERAVRAALAMRDALVEYAAETDRPITMRCGVNTGLALLGDVGTTGEFSAIGDAVNLTRRLEQAARPGTVLISHATYRHVRGIFDVTPMAPIDVKGKSRPVRTYRVERTKPLAFRLVTRGVEGVETRMVGRDAELAALQEEVRGVAADGGARFVTVTGEAGVGKSRLLYEFDDWLDLQPDTYRYFKGRARPDTAASAYGVVRDMLASRFEILENDGADAVAQKLRLGTSDVLTPGEADLVGHTVGFDLSASPAVQRLLGSPAFGRIATAHLTRYLRYVAREPTVMVIEDIHWADDSSLDLVEHLAAELPDARLLVVCSTRPVFFERRPEWRANGDGSAGADGCDPRQAGFSMLRLEPLSVSDSQALVDEILRRVERVPDSLRDLVVGGAEGNPYYLEELIKMLVDDGVIVRGEETWRIRTDRLTVTRVPSTLTGVLQARLDGLSRAEHLVLQCAAVVGRRFWDSAVAGLIGQGVDDVAYHLDGLRKRELVYRHEPSTFAGTTEYVFQHAILHEVTYETVLLKQRSEYHRRVARWLERAAGDRLAEFLSPVARHHELAGDRSDAARCWHQAGEEFQKVSAYGNAVAAMERGLALRSDGEVVDRARDLIDLGNLHRLIGEIDAAMPCLRQGLALAQAAGDARAEVAALNGLGQAVRVQGDLDEAERFLREGLALARQADDREGAGVSLYCLGDVAYRRGDSERAERHASESLTICRDIDNRQGIAFALRVLGFAADARGDYNAATRYQRESQAMYREIGDRWGVAAGHINLGESARKQGRFEEAARHYEQSLAIAEDTGARYEVVISRNNLGQAKASMGRTAEAEPLLRRALADSHNIGAMPIVLEALVGLAVLRSRAGHMDSAAELLGQVLTHPTLNDEIRRFAAPVLDELRQALPESALEDALARGAAMALGDMVAALTPEPGEPGRASAMG